MKKITVVLAAAIVSAPLLSASSAAADTPGCVSRAEFRAVHKGMHRPRVARIFDTNGKLSYRSGGYMSRDYNTCAKYASVSVNYRYHRDIGAWIVSGKSGFWA